MSKTQFRKNIRGWFVYVILTLFTLLLVFGISNWVSEVGISGKYLTLFGASGLLILAIFGYAKL